jgi:hypothetical protein
MKFNRRRFIKLSAAAAAIGSVGYGLESNVASISDVELPLPGLKQPLRVLFVSDLHLPRCFVSQETIEAAADEFQPDLVAIGGDSFDRKKNVGLVACFGGLTAPLGKFAILGNWERWSQCRDEVVAEHYDKVGVKLLINQRVELPVGGGAKLQIIGLEDLLGGVPNLQMVQSPGKEIGTRPADRSLATLVMAHCPALFDQITLPDALCLSGHTHGGQISPLGIAVYTPNGSGSYVRGLYPGFDGRQLYVTRGLGNNGAPFRIGVRPEIVRLTLLPVQ